MKSLLFFFCLWAPLSFAFEEITPFKYEESPALSYKIPVSSRHTVARTESETPPIVYYFSPPPSSTFYPLAVLCGGSLNKDNLGSIIHFHRYFLKEFQELNIGVLTLEHWGIDGATIDEEDFFQHYTISQRLKDHKQVIGFLSKNPPLGWNGKLVFLGVSEGGPLVTSLTTSYQDRTLATINWCGARGMPWKEEAWLFLQSLFKKEAICPLHKEKLRKCPCGTEVATRVAYENKIEEILKNPLSLQEFMGMTYLYHADVLNAPEPEYRKIVSPFLVVAGTKDNAISSNDAFVTQALSQGTPITYLRIEDMDHYIRKCPEVIEKSFQWLQAQLKRKDS